MAVGANWVFQRRYRGISRQQEEIQMSMYERWAAKAPIKTDPTVWQDDKTLKETKLELAGPQYRVWAQHLRRSGAMPIEFILPRLEIVCQNVLPPSMQAAEERYIR